MRTSHIRHCETAWPHGGRPEPGTHGKKEHGAGVTDTVFAPAERELRTLVALFLASRAHHRECAGKDMDGHRSAPPQQRHRETAANPSSTRRDHSWQRFARGEPRLPGLVPRSQKNLKAVGSKWHCTAMNEPVFDIMPLERAIQRLEEGLERYRGDNGDLQIRDGLILRFGFTYELGHKALRRYLKLSSPTPALFDQMRFQDQIRTANDQGLLLGGWPEWRGYRTMRGMTSHMARP